MRISSIIPMCLLTACAAAIPAQTFTLVHVFHGADGAEPAALVEDTTGTTLYGATAFGGASGLGTLYKLNTKAPYKETVLHSFSASTDGQNPGSGLVLGSDGKLYGTAGSGGPNGFGTAFRSTTAGAFSVFYNFVDGAQAAYPGILVAGPNALYGTAGGGAPFYGGIVYSLSTAGETDLYEFAGGADGNHPSWIVRDSAGNIYGTASGGDMTCTTNGGCGVLFKIDAKGVYSVLHVFIGLDGNGPSGLVFDPAGNLYGTTGSGGAHNAGTVFEFTPAGKLTTLYSFTGGADGGYPQSGVVRDSAGNLYGTTSQGGLTTTQCNGIQCGVVFMLAPTAAGTWSESVLHAFNGTDGQTPLAPLLIDPSGPTIYGTTDRGGDYSCSTINGGNSCGVVFKITR